MSWTSGGCGSSARSRRRRGRRRRAPDPRGRAPPAPPWRPSSAARRSPSRRRRRPCPRLARSDSAERSASLIIFFGVRWAYERGLGPRAMPPPVNCGARIDPWRAWPVPFWRYGLAPPPRTSARVFVLWVPARRLASWAVTTWCITGTLGWMPNIASSSSTVPASLPARSFSVISAIAQPSFTAALDGVADDDDAAVGTRDRALDEQQVALGVGLDDLQVERGHLLVAHLAGHPHPLEHPAREGARTDRARRPVVLVVAVAGALALEVVALHRAGEALAPADRGDVDLGAGGDGVDGDLLADLVAVDRVEAQLDQALAGGDVGLGEVAGLGLGQLPRVAEARR